MQKKIKAKGTALIIQDVDTGLNDKVLPIRDTFYSEDKLKQGIIVLAFTDGRRIYTLDPIDLATAVDKDGVLFTEETFRDFCITFLNRLDVTVQDPINPLAVAKLSTIEVLTTLAAPTAKNDLTIDIDDATGIVQGSYISVFSTAKNRFYLANVISVNVNELTLDTPLDFEYSIGDPVASGSTNLAVDGSSTPVVFGVRNTTEQIGATFHVTRLMFQCETQTTADLSKFGDIVGGITNGIVVRKKDGVYRNLFNAKTNGDLKGLMFDFELVTALGAQQDGFSGRLNFYNLGAVIELTPGEDLELIVQDDLTSLIKFEVTAEGHETIE